MSASISIVVATVPSARLLMSDAVRRRRESSGRLRCDTLIDTSYAAIDRILLRMLGAEHACMPRRAAASTMPCALTICEYAG